MIKTFNKLGLEGNFSQSTKGIYEKPRANIILNGFPLRSGKVIHSLLLFSYVLEFLSKALKQEKKKKKTSLEKEQNYLYLKKISSHTHEMLQNLLTITRNKHIHQGCKNAGSVYKNQWYSYRLVRSTGQVN